MAKFTSSDALALALNLLVFLPQEQKVCLILIQIGVVGNQNHSHTLLHELHPRPASENS
jgi:hypothetical protein